LSAHNYRSKNIYTFENNFRSKFCDIIVNWVSWLQNKMI
ncbi:MAG: hypothetical protein ACI8TS_001206, partial [Flavobacteriales bacterium]